MLSVAAVFQDDPSGLLINPSSSVRRFEDLQGKTVIARPEWTFLALLKKKYGVTVNVVPQSFSVAAFLGDKEAIQQGYFIAEPYFIEKAGGAKPASFPRGTPASALTRSFSPIANLPAKIRMPSARSCGPT